MSSIEETQVADELVASLVNFLAHRSAACQRTPAVIRRASRGDGSAHTGPVSRCRKSGLRAAADDRATLPSLLAICPKAVSRSGNRSLIVLDAGAARGGSFVPLGSPGQRIDSFFLLLFPERSLGMRKGKGVT